MSYESHFSQISYRERIKDNADNAEDFCLFSTGLQSPAICGLKLCRKETKNRRNRQHQIRSNRRRKTPKNVNGSFWRHPLSRFSIFKAPLTKPENDAATTVEEKRTTRRNSLHRLHIQKSVTDRNRSVVFFFFFLFCRASFRSIDR